MKHTDDAYLAGILDGEGCVMISRKKSKRSRGGYAFALVVTVTNTCRPLLDHLCAVTGFGNIAPHSDSRPNMKQAWIWSLWSNQAKSVLCRVLPFLVVKKLQAELAIKFAATIRSGIGSKGLTKEELTERAQMYRTMRLLNRRGPNKDPIWMKNALADGWLAPADPENLNALQMPDNQTD